MKNVLLSFVFLFLGTSLIAGKPVKEEPENTPGASSAPVTPVRVLKSIKGTIESMAHIPAIAPIETELTLNFVLTCSQRFEKFSFLLRDDGDDSQTILAAAIVSEEESATAIECPEESDNLIHQEVIKLAGLFTDVSLEHFYLSPVSAGSLNVPPGTEAIVAIDDITVKAITPLCPKDPGIRCITDGTVISLDTSMICVNGLAGISFTTEQVGDEIHINLLGLEYQNKFHDKVKCMEKPINFSITAIMEFADAPEKVKIHLLP